jgi:hypothetical protein
MCRASRSALPSAPKPSSPAKGIRHGSQQQRARPLHVVVTNSRQPHEADGTRQVAEPGVNLRGTVGGVP